MKNIKNTSNPIKILMTADTVGGVWTYAIDLAKALKDYDIEIHLATMGRFADEDQKEQVRAAGNIVLYESHFKLEWMDSPWEDVDNAGEWLLEIEAKVAPDLIHLNNYCHGNLAWSTPTLMVCHSCIFSWWEAVKHEKAPKYYQEYFDRVKKGILAVDIIVAPSKAMLAGICRNYNCDIVYSKIIPNGTSFSPSPSLKEDFVFSMGRVWDEAKNIGKLDLIASKIEWPIVVAGDKCLTGEEVETPFPNLNTVGRLNQKCVRQTLEKAAIYVLPAKYEPFGLSVLEAAKAGCALVLGDIPSLKENWTDAALFVNPDDEELLASTINMLIEDPELLKEYAAKALARAEEFNIDKTAEAYVEEYENLIQYYTKYHFA